MNSDQDPRRPLRVLHSFGRPRATTNPYIAMLTECLDQHVEVEQLTFKWRRALTADVDVFHAHWPEILVSGHSRLKMVVRQVLFCARRGSVLTWLLTITRNLAIDAICARRGASAPRLRTT